MEVKSPNSSVSCPHCGKLSSDQEYCDHCNKPIAQAVRPQEDQSQGRQARDDALATEFVHDTPQGERWGSAQVPATVHWMDEEPSPSWFQHELPMHCVERPFHWLRLAGRWALCFFRSSCPRLPEYMRSRCVERQVEFSDCVPILMAAFGLFAEVHKRKCIVGDLDPSCLLVEAKDPGTLRLQLLQTQPFLAQKPNSSSIEPRPTFGLDSPEVRNGQSDLWAPTSDVFLLGSVMVGLLTGRDRFVDFAELEHLAHQIRAFAPSAPIQLHPWLRKSCSADPSGRFSSLEQQRDEFRRLLERAQERGQAKTRSLKVGGGGTSRMGIGKLRDEDDFRLETEVNQDRFLFHWGKDQQQAIAAVADGITNARYGSGSRAAEIVCQDIERAWETGQLTTLDSIREVLIEANARVVAESAGFARKAGAAELRPSDLMGATAAVCVVHDNQAHVVSCGDTRIYLWSHEDGLMLLTLDHNQMNRALRAGEPWPAARGLEDAEALTAHLGCCDVSEGEARPRDPDFYRETVPLRPNDLIILCTDGLTDYFGRIAGGKGLWNSELSLEQYVAEEASGNRLSIKRLIEKLTDEANRNGGGDNITTVIMRVVEAGPNRPELAVAEEARPSHRTGKESSKRR